MTAEAGVSPLPVDDLVALTQLAAAFDDATNRRDTALFATLWADDGEWQIGDPFPLQVDGRSAVVEAWERLLADERWLFRASYAGVVHADPTSPDRATGRWPSVEIGRRADGGSYFNYAVYADDYIRDGSEWRFAARRYAYAYLDGSNLRGAGGPELSAARR